MLPHPSSHWKADTDFQNNYWCHLSVTSWQMIVFLFCKMVTLKELIIISKLHLYTFKDVSQKHIFYTSENDKYGFTHLMFSKCCLYLLKLFHCTAIMKYLILLLYKLSILVSIGWYSHRLQHNHMLKGPMKSFRKIKLNTPTHTCMHTHTHRETGKRHKWIYDCYFHWWNIPYNLVPCLTHLLFNSNIPTNKNRHKQEKDMQDLA